LNKYKIREMNLNDYLKVFDLWSNTEDMGLSDSDSEESISKFLKRNAGHSFVCTDREEIIGTILCGHDGRRGFLYHVAVSKEYRKNGIGKRLGRVFKFMLTTAQSQPRIKKQRTKQPTYHSASLISDSF